jgi:hypothetical protein|tara:strand:+ start:55 stop:201 length:147 start_codon:yes stop_codon:yes gene_type:complete
MTEEGVRRSRGIRRGKSIDYPEFEILREEWDQIDFLPTRLNDAPSGFL